MYLAFKILFTFIVIGGGAFLMICLHSLRRIPNEPPHIGVVTRFGERKEKTKKEGIRFFFMYPWIYNAILIDATKKNMDIPAVSVRTPDMAELKIPLSITFTPDKANIIPYLDSGGENGVKNILEDIAVERLRRWASNEDEGPQDWEAAIKSRDEALEVLVETIVGLSDTTPEERKNLVSEIRRGNGVQSLKALGIVLNRLNIGEITIMGELAKAAEKQAKEKRERLAEAEELDHIREQLELLKEKGYSPEQALEVVQTERGKVKKDIKEVKWNISQETRDSLGDIIKSIFGG